MTGFPWYYHIHDAVCHECDGTGRSGARDFDEWIRFSPMRSTPVSSPWRSVGRHPSASISLAGES